MSKIEVKLEVAAKTDTGMVRNANEDNFIVTIDGSSGEWIVPKGNYTNSDTGTVLVVSDGMGGLNAGEVASKIAVESIKEYIITESASKKNGKSIQNILEGSIINAHAEIVKHGIKYPDTEGMGCTIVMALIKEDKIHVAWVGDSRCYMLRKGELTQLSKDHSYVQSLVDEGKITKDQAFYHPESNIITQSVGDADRKPKPDYAVFPLAEEDMIMLCSDGLNGMLKDEELQNILNESKDLPKCTEMLVDGANKNGGTDNITVLLAKITTCKNCSAQNNNESVTNETQNGSAKRKGNRLKRMVGAFTVLIALGFIAFFSISRNSGSVTQGTIQKDSVSKDTGSEKSNKASGNTGKKDSAGNTTNDHKKNQQESKEAERALKNKTEAGKPETIHKQDTVSNSELTRLNKADSLRNEQKKQDHKPKPNEEKLKTDSL